MSGEGVPGVRNVERGKAHIDTGGRDMGCGCPVSLCGRVIHAWWPVPWDQAAPEDRCGQCERRTRREATR